MRRLLKKIICGIATPKPTIETDREGFEPAIRITQYTGLAIQCFNPYSAIPPNWQEKTSMLHYQKKIMPKKPFILKLYFKFLLSKAKKVFYQCK